MERSIVRELVTLFGFDVDEAKLSKYDRIVKQMKTGLRQAAWAATKFALVTGYVTRQVAREGNAIITTARRLNMSTDALQEWRYAADLANVGADNFSGSLETFATRIGQAARGQGAAVTALARLGIQLRDEHGNIRDINTLLEESFIALERFGTGAEQAELASKLFNMSGAQLLQLLSGGYDGLKKLRAEAHKFGAVMKYELLEQSEKSTKSWHRFLAALKGVRNVLAEDMLPAMTRMLDSFGDFLLKNRDMVALLGKVAIAAMALRIPLLLLGAPMALLVAGIAAIALIAQDFYVALTNPKAKSLIKAIGNGIEWLAKKAGAWIYDTISNIAGWIIEELEFVWEWWKNVSLSELPGMIIDALGAVKDWIWDTITEAAEYVRKAMKVVTGGPTSLGEFIEDRRRVNQGLPTLEQMQLANKAQGIGSQISYNVTINQAPGQSPEAVAVEVGKLLITKKSAAFNRLGHVRSAP